MASQTATNTPFGSKIAKNFALVASNDSPKVKDGKELALDSVVPVVLTDQVMFPFSIGSSLHSFIGPLLDIYQVEEVHTFFPCIMT